jgi:hypothetical protein
MSNPSIRCGCGTSLDGIQVAPGTNCRRCGLLLVTAEPVETTEAAAEIALLQKQIQRLAIEKEMAQLDQTWEEQKQPFVESGVASQDDKIKRYGWLIGTLIMLLIYFCNTWLLYDEKMGWMAQCWIALFIFMVAVSICQMISRRREIDRYKQARAAYRKRREELLATLKNFLPTHH